MVSDDFRAAAFGIGRIWRQRRRGLPLPVREAFLDLLLICKPYFAPDDHKSTAANIAEARAEVRGFIELCGAVADRRAYSRVDVNPGKHDHLECGDLLPPPAPPPDDLECIYSADWTTMAASPPCMVFQSPDVQGAFANDIFRHLPCPRSFWNISAPVFIPSEVPVARECSSTTGLTSQCVDVDIDSMCFQLHESDLEDSVAGDFMVAEFDTDAQSQSSRAESTGGLGFHVPGGIGSIGACCIPVDTVGLQTSDEVSHDFDAAAFMSQSSRTELTDDKGVHVHGHGGYIDAGHSCIVGTSCTTVRPVVSHASGGDSNDFVAGAHSQSSRAESTGASGALVHGDICSPDAGHSFRMKRYKFVHTLSFVPFFEITPDLFDRIDDGVIHLLFHNTGIEDTVGLSITDLNAYISRLLCTHFGRQAKLDPDALRCSIERGLLRGLLVPTSDSFHFKITQSGRSWFMLNFEL